ncbi:MAG: hypothetical protein ABJB01_07140 [Rudaea sp.]
MPVFNFDFNASCTNLDMSAAPSGLFTPSVVTLELTEGDLQRFNSAVRLFAPSHSGFSADQIAGAARRVLRASAKGQDSTFIKVRMRRGGEVRAALDDRQWDIAEPVEKSMRALVDYLDDRHGLIPNDVPIVGLLDDAILIDVAMDSLRTELDEYADFCRFRTSEAGRQGVFISVVDINREQWMTERKLERQLEQQLRRVRGSSYACGVMENKFRIC